MLRELLHQFMKAADDHTATQRDLVNASREYEHAKAAAYVKYANAGKSHYLAQNLATVDKEVSRLRLGRDEADVNNRIAWREVGKALYLLRAESALQQVTKSPVDYLGDWGQVDEADLQIPA